MTADGAPAPAVAAGAAVIGALHAAGVSRVVLSPGSRSAPLSRAAAAAEARGLLDLAVRVDERSAGFLALGMAKASGGPVAVLCTSGTAVANLLPAVVEARYAGVPLVVITADRPPELRGRGASQTIDQVGIFDGFVIGSRDLPTPRDDSWSAAPITELVRLAARARGPVHANIGFRPPVVGPLPTWQHGRPEAPAAPAAPVRSVVEGAARGAVLVGDLDPGDEAVRAAVLDTAAAHGWPIIAEASSGLLGRPGVVPGGTALLADPAARERLRPDLVITVGPFGLDRGVLAWVRSADRHFAVRLRPRTDAPDPLATAEAVLPRFPDIEAAEPDPEWLADWNSALRAPMLAVPRTDWSVAAVAEHVWGAMGQHELLLVAASTSLRAVAARAVGPGPAVLANRGANGIDGLVSTAWGAASVWPAPAVALLGDLALLHDLNGLLVPSVEERPDLTLVIADNNGGGIFRTLEQGDPQYADTYERIFATPHDRDVGELLRAHAVATVQVTDAAGLARELAVPRAGAGVRAVVAVLPPA